MSNNSTLPFAVAIQLAQQAGRGLWRSIEKLFRSLIDGTLIVYPRVVVGTIAATATTMVVNLGFTPDSVQIFNVTDAKMLAWQSPDTAATGMLFATQVTVVASGGVTPITTAGSEGFQVGAEISGVSKTLRYVAIKNRPTA